MQPLGCLPELNIPRLENLRKLTLCEDWEPEQQQSAMFPPLCEMADVFPNLKELGKKTSTVAKKVPN